MKSGESASSKIVEAFGKQIGIQLILGKKHNSSGLGTFSTCSRKASEDRPACTIAMFRASDQLRHYVAGRAQEQFDGPNAEAAQVIAELLRENKVAVVPGLGRFEVTDLQKPKPKFTFEAVAELNARLGQGA